MESLYQRTSVLGWIDKAVQHFEASQSRFDNDYDDSLARSVQRTYVAADQDGTATSNIQPPPKATKKRSRDDMLEHEFESKFTNVVYYMYLYEVTKMYEQLKQESFAKEVSRVAAQTNNRTALVLLSGIIEFQQVILEAQAALDRGDVDDAVQQLVMKLIRVLNTYRNSFDLYTLTIIPR